ncbi:unnamed protein product [Clavelina lepadiformis]|uniref:MAM domain-containing protein n=1 Tax=Clavelina lepadiformis TaxID=159417 RepID=A0ABP0G7R6_CLALP
MDQREPQNEPAYIQGSTTVKKKPKHLFAYCCPSAPTSSDRHRSSFIRSKRARNFGAVLLLVALLIAVVVIVVILMTRSEADETSVAPKKNPLLCHIGKNPVDSRSSSHGRCDTLLEVVNSTTVCQERGDDAWYTMAAGTFDREEVDQLLPPNLTDFSAIVISPNYLLPNDSCHLQVNFNFSFQSNYAIYVTSPAEGHRKISVTSQTCHYGALDDPQFLSNSQSLRFIIVSSGPIGIEGASGSVTSQPCESFESVGFSPVVGSHPEFAVVGSGSRNLCSFEIFNKTTVDCDWWRVTSLGSAAFTRTDHRSCVEFGVSHDGADNNPIWFLTLDPISDDTKAFLISPILDTNGATHLLLSLWYIAQCNGTHLRVYLVPSYRDVGAVTSELTPVEVIRGPEKSFRWEFASIDVEIPAGYNTVQVVIEGVVSSTGDCGGHLCHLGHPTTVTAVERPLLALDDLGVEVRYDQCTSDKPSSIDCTFGAPGNSLCGWTSSRSDFIPAEIMQFHHWVVENDDRGDESFLKFNVMALPEHDAFFRSPLVVARSTCSCLLSFRYRLFGAVGSTRLQTNLVLGRNTTAGSRPLKPQWSVYGEISQDWIPVQVLLNLDPSQPFQVEFRILGGGSGSKAYVDDFVFHQCDIGEVRNPS